MTLPPGTRLGPYEIQALIGAGGMGEVFRARDTKLNRDVAIKVLPAAFEDDPERLARFTREAQTLASLNHPNIATIHGIEEVPAVNGSTGPGSRALVMELVEGEDLSAHIARGPIPIAEALPIARQIAEALEAAHEHGIVHRDLKPGNIKVRPDGTVKVLDFGLAKAMDTGDSSSNSNLSHSPTLTRHGTSAGLIIGTAAYMSPEQAKGKPVDKRADIWAFGVVLYEMLSGKRAFKGDDVSEILASVLKDTVSMDALPKATPPRLKRLIERCLDRDLKTRLRDIGEARVKIARVAAGAPETWTIEPVGTTSAPPWRRFVPWGIAAGAVAVSLALWARQSSDAVHHPLRMSTVDMGPTVTAPQISPDGSTVAYVRHNRVAVRRLDETEGREIEGTDDASNPFWSADGRSVGYFVQVEPPQIRMVGLADGKSRVVVSDSTGKTTPFPPFGAAACGGGIYYPVYGEGLFFGSEGATPRLIAPLEKGELSWAFPSCLADGRILGLVRTKEGGESTNEDGYLVVVLDGGRRAAAFRSRDPMRFPSNPVVGYLVFQRAASSSLTGSRGIWALPVKADLSAVTGAAFMLLPDAAQPSVSANGLLVALTGQRRGDRQLVWADRNGARLGLFGRPQALFSNPAVSKDGSIVAVSNGRSGGDGTTVWLHSESSVREWGPAVSDWSPLAWSPDGKGLAYFDGPRLMLRSLVGREEPRTLATAAFDVPVGLSWTPDGRNLVYATAVWSKEGPRTTTMMVGVDTKSAPRALLAAPKAFAPAVSPDGTLLAYSEFTLDRIEVFVTTFPDPGPVWPVSVGGGRWPRWSPRGGELFYAGGPRVGDDPNSQRDLFVVKIEARGGVKVSPPRVLFNASARGFELAYQGIRTYDVGPDGQRFIVQTDGLEGVPTVTLIDDLAALLRKPR